MTEPQGLFGSDCGGWSKLRELRAQARGFRAGERILATARIERRLAAIMATDIVGYSSLIERDEARTLASIKAIRAEVIHPLLESHKGRIAKLMGDGAIVEFGSVVDAVTCGVALQQAV